LRLALAQIKPVAGDIDNNLASHLKCVEKAHLYQCDAIFFPELSLTGYEPELAHELGMHFDDVRLNPFQEKSDSYNMVLGVGVPTIKGDNRLISMVVFQPNKDRTIYSKQLLHADELPFFIPGDDQQYVTVQGVKIALAICYESVQMAHFTNAMQKSFDIYLASVAKPQRAITNAHNHYKQLAIEFNIPVLMVNSVGPSDNFIACGNSAVWSKNGDTFEIQNSDQEALLLYNHMSLTTSIH